ncbi:Polysaccharide biosynthesis protein CpsF [Lachnospiraceae bacterium TWA4]|nr:Polysaccharide biosynthesis protein CpsF [Lachnospiraceae bacterium TWA4]
MLRPLLDKYDGFILTEKTGYDASVKNAKIYYVAQVNRKEKSSWFKLFYNGIISLFIYLRERPNIIICTGVLAMIPMCLLVKLFGGKLIFIESFAKVTSPTKTGAFLYRFADRFYVQWETMKEIYPNSVYLGGIY